MVAFLKHWNVRINEKEEQINDFQSQGLDIIYALLFQCDIRVSFRLIKQFCILNLAFST